MSLRLYRVVVDSNVYKHRVFFLARESGTTVSDVQRNFSQGEVNSCTDLGSYDPSRSDEYRDMYDVPPDASIG